MIMRRIVDALSVLIWIDWICLIGIFSNIRVGDGRGDDLIYLMFIPFLWLPATIVLYVARYFARRILRRYQPDPRPAPERSPEAADPAREALGPMACQRIERSEARGAAGDGDRDV